MCDTPKAETADTGHNTDHGRTDTQSQTHTRVPYGAPPERPTLCLARDAMNQI